MFRQLAISCLFAVLLLPADARTRPHYGGTIRVEVNGDPLAVPSGLARDLLFDGLTTFGPDGSVQPALAVAWRSEDRDHRWQLSLRSGVTFHDGSPLTATSVVNSLNRSCNGHCPWSVVHAVGSQVVFTADSPMPQLPALLAEDEFLIALTLGADGLPPTNPIGTGPFQFVSAVRDTVTLAANQNCWRGRPFADTIEIRGHRAVRDQWLDLSVGRTDVVEIPPEMLRQARQQQLTIVASPPVTLLALQLLTTSALANPMLRASIAQAVDRSALFNVIFQKQGDLTAALLPQQLTGYAFLFPPDRNLGKAIALRGGLTTASLKLAAEGDSAMQLAAQRLALNLHDAGFPVQVVPGNTPNPDLLLRRLPLESSDPAAALAVLMHSAGQNDPANASTPSALFRVEKNILDMHSIVPLLDLPRAWAVSGKLRDFALRADGAPDLANTSLESTQ
ncbi:MAG TPA: ABC transporter substrate-binding protein [Terracidiphilus sp.]|nr:ABC transporter substrate-binding protein [Terracidiphilus sp.]